MDIKVDIDAAAVQQQVAQAIVNSAIGEQIAKAVTETLTKRTGGWDSKTLVEAAVFDDSPTPLLVMEGQAMKTEHTPGPWEADATDISISQERDVCPAHRRGKRLNGGYIVARLPGPDREANARLIAAAPEMLALLIESQDSIGGDWRARRDAVIAKATGAPHA